jgi:galactose-1-phosphate uridylyltransferase
MSISSSKPITINNDSIVCPFCSLEVLRSEGRILNQKGQMLWLDNKYPILENTKQTLIIETNNCIDNLSSYSEEHAKELFDFAFKTRNHMMAKMFKDVRFEIG